jgi:hypothetical protein
VLVKCSLSEACPNASVCSMSQPHEQRRLYGYAYYWNGCGHDARVVILMGPTIQTQVVEIVEGSHPGCNYHVVCDTDCGRCATDKIMALFRGGAHVP